MISRGTSKSAVSRRFVAKTAAQLAAAIDALDLVGLLVDGVHIGEHCIVVALGIDHVGRKHALGLSDSSTEPAAVCQSLLADLQSRGLRTHRSLLVILDGSKALHNAVTQTFGSAALIHGCQVHKLRNILEHLPEGPRPWVRAIVARAYKQVEVAPLVVSRRIWRDDLRTGIRMPQRVCAKASTRPSPSSRSVCPIASDNRSRRPTPSKACSAARGM
jgi:hypothetical protein